MSTAGESSNAFRKPRVPLYVWVLGAGLLGVIVVGWEIIGPAVREARAVKDLEKIPGVRISQRRGTSKSWWSSADKMLGFPLVAPEFQVFVSRSAPLDELSRLDLLRKIHGLTIRHDELKTRHFSEFRSLQRAQIVRLTGSRHESIDLAPLKNASVSILELTDLNIDDEDMEVLVALPNLSWLELRNVPIGDSGIRMLARTKQLRLLVLSNTKVTFDGMRDLGILPPAKTLVLSGPQFTDGQADLLPSNFGVDWLQLSGCRNLSDEGLARMTVDPAILDVSDTGVRFTEATVKWLQSRKRLKTIRISPHQLSKDDIARFNGLGGPQIDDPVDN